jgi:Flp pilus assembly pilin Flp
MVEYGIMVALVAAIAVGLVRVLGGDVRALFDSVPSF